MPRTHDPLAALCADFRGWMIWQTKAGRWWAWQKISIAQYLDGWRGVFDADSASDLRKKLRAQMAKRKPAAVTQ